MRRQDLPLAVHANETEESDQCVPHQCNTTTLRCAVEEGNLGFVLLERVGKVHGSLPRVRVDSLRIVAQTGDVRCAIDVDANFVTVLNHQAWQIARTEFPSNC
jgi:hypothetical protein